MGDDGELLGKPRNQADAFKMIKGFVGGEHAVVTACCLIDIQQPNQRSVFCDQAFLRFGKISDKAIVAFIKTDAWQGKSGGYNLFERQEAGWDITVMQGDDPTTVVGLPMQILIQQLKTFGITPNTK